MSVATPQIISTVIKDAAHRLSGRTDDYDPLLDRVNDARLCLLGEATHGTHEFYRERAEITKRLIKEKSYTAVANRDGRIAQDEFFFAEQNARLVLNAERYYRTMFRGRVESWNLRDQHMVETLNALIDHLGAQGDPAKVAVWEHNSHLGDARATYMSDYGELNVGQLVRERYGNESVLVGFTTYTGTVTAATDWDGPAERKRVRPALQNSYEDLFHQQEIGDFLIDLKPGPAEVVLRRPLLERAIGVIYLPQTERQSHYFDARLADQFDVVIHLDETTALEPLERVSLWENGEPPETYPTGV